MVSGFGEMIARAMTKVISSGFLILFALVTWGSLMESSEASDMLVPGARPKVSFTVSDRVGSKDVSASVTFAADGLQRLPPDGQLAVNGQVIEPKRLQKQGFWYQDRIARAVQYELLVRRSRTAPQDRLIIRPRVFLPHLPTSVARGADLRIQFDGPPPNPGERLFLKLTSDESATPAQRWQIILKAEVQGNTIVISGEALLAAVPGNALLYVGLTCSQPVPDSDAALTFAIGTEAPVRVTN